MSSRKNQSSHNRVRVRRIGIPHEVQCRLRSKKEKSLLIRLFCQRELVRINEWPAIVEAPRMHWIYDLHCGMALPYMATDRIGWLGRVVHLLVSEI